MGFEILPIDNGGENVYDVFTITSPDKWIPHRFVNTKEEEHYYDPSDDTQLNFLDKQEGYPAYVNHLTQGNFTVIKTCFNLCDVTTPLIDTHIHATSTWHCVIYQEIDPPRHLGPYL